MAKLNARQLVWIGPIALFLCSCGEPAQPTQHVSLASSVVVPGQTWFELAAPEQLLTTSYHHEVCFDPVAPFALAEHPMGVLDKNQQRIVVQVKVSGDRGELELPLLSYTGFNTICFGVSDTKLDQIFDRVNLFASQELPIENLRWSSNDK